MASINDIHTPNFVVEGLKDQIQQIDRLLASNPEMEKRMQKVVSKVLAKARSKMQKDISSSLPSDPRNAAKAVRKAVYKQILGGNINILRKLKASGKTTDYQPTRTLKAGQRGGNRKLRSAITRRMNSYAGTDRGFILFWLNSGTQPRNIESFRTDPHRENVVRGARNGNISKYGNIANVNTGNRGSISARNVFASHIGNLSNFINQELLHEFSDLLTSQV